MLDKFIIFENIRSNKAVLCAASLFRMLDDGEEIDIASYYELQRMLLSHAKGCGAGTNIWQDFLCALVAESDNLFSRNAELGKRVAWLVPLLARELAYIRDMLLWDWSALAQKAHDGGCSVATAPGIPEERMSRRESMLRLLLADYGDGAAAGAERLFDYYNTYGCGIFEKYRVFTWDKGLRGIELYDTVKFEDLIGYELQKEKLLTNVGFFLEGLPYHHMLLYGDRGTGKSSCVKALLNHFDDKNLKLLALARNEMDSLPDVIQMLEQRGCRTILYIDDLSFEENETGYKAFKSALEGGATGRMSKVMVCVTSNRRNIIREVWKDREGQDDININDSIQEKRSLADRFGLAIPFIAPDKEEYLEIVRGLADKADISMETADLDREALAFAVRQGGRSCRAARQFVDMIIAREGSRI